MEKRGKRQKEGFFHCCGRKSLFHKKPNCDLMHVNCRLYGFYGQSNLISMLTFPYVIFEKDAFDLT